MEYLRPDMRTLGLNMCIGLFYCVGTIAVPWVALVALPVVLLGAHAAGSLLLLAAPRERSLAHPEGQSTRGRVLLPDDIGLQREGELPSAAVDAFKVTLSAALQTGEKRGQVHRLYEPRYIISYAGSLNYCHMRVTIDGVWTGNSIY
jgi:hypothetical protein